MWAARDQAYIAAGFLRGALVFRHVCRPQDELATDVAGVFAYWGDCRVLDTWGLNSRAIARRGRPRNATRFETYGVVAPEIVLERRPRFILPFPPVPMAIALSKTQVLARVFPEGFFVNRPEMDGYELRVLQVPSGRFAYLERR
jgi:hypothetical protein